MKNFERGGGVILQRPNPQDANYNQIFADEIGQAITPINWKEFLPDNEEQKAIPFCLSFSALNSAEAVARKEGIELNLSDRYLGVISGTSKQGNSLQAVADAFRNKGVVKEEACKWKPEWLTNPYTYWKQIFSLADVDTTARLYYGGNWSWVYGREAMKNALAYSPVRIAIGVGQNYNSDQLIKDPKVYGAYHAITLYHIDEVGNMFIQDSIAPFYKLLDKNYKIYYAISGRPLVQNWREIQEKNMPKLICKKGSSEIYVQTSKGRYYVTSMDVLRDWDFDASLIEAVDIFTTPLIGILGDANILDFLRYYFGKIE